MVQVIEYLLSAIHFACNQSQAPFVQVAVWPFVPSEMFARLERSLNPQTSAGSPPYVMRLLVVARSAKTRELMLTTYKPLTKPLFNL